MNTNINVLPTELTNHIVSYVGTKDLTSLSLVNKFFFNLIENSTSFNVQEFYLRKFKCFNMSINTYRFQKDNLSCQCLDNEFELLKLFNKDALKHYNKDLTKEFLVSIRMNYPKLALYFLENKKVDLLRDVEHDQSYFSSPENKTIELYREAIAWSIRKGHHKVLEFLLKNENIHLSLIDLNILVIVGSRLGYYKIVRLLIENPKILFSIDVAKNALKFSIEYDKNNQNYKVFNLLLAKYQNFFSDDFLHELLKLALYKDYYNILELLMKNNRINLKSVDLTDAIQKALGKGCFKTLELLLTNENIDFKTIDLSAIGFNGEKLETYEKIFELLISKNNINFNFNLDGLKHCYKSFRGIDYENNIQKFLREIHFSPNEEEYNDYSNELEDEKNLRKVIANDKIFFNNVEDYIESLIEDLSYIAKSKHMKYLKHLFKKKSLGISSDEFNLLFQNADDIGRSAMIKKLLKIHNIILSEEELHNIYKNIEKKSKLTEFFKSEIKNILCE